MTAVPTPSQPPRAHPRRFAVAVRVLIAFAVLLVVTGGVLGYRLGTASTDAMRARPFSTPGTTSLSLTPGSWVVYEQTGRTSQVGPVTSTFDGPVSLAPDDVRVTDGGTSVPVTTLDANETITEDGTIYTGAVTFRVSRAGTYAVDVTSLRSHVRIGPDIDESFGRSAGWFAATGVALLGVLVSGGVTWGSRRRLVPVRPVVAAGPDRPAVAPPGWYPDPRGTGAMLWWDGRLWRVPGRRARRPTTTRTRSDLPCADRSLPLVRTTPWVSGPLESPSVKRGCRQGVESSRLWRVANPAVQQSYSRATAGLGCRWSRLAWGMDEELAPQRGARDAADDTAVDAAAAAAAGSVAERAGGWGRLREGLGEPSSWRTAEGGERTELPAADHCDGTALVSLWWS